jgi:hypothetical protein
MAFIQEHYVAILIALLSVSEVLALIPALKANSIFQLIIGIIKSLVPQKK